MCLYPPNVSIISWVVFLKLSYTRIHTQHVRHVRVALEPYTVNGVTITIEMKCESGSISLSLHLVYPVNMCVQIMHVLSVGVYT